MKTILIILLVCVCNTVLPADEGHSAREDKALVRLFETLKEEDNYGYDMTIISRLETGNSNIQQDTTHMSSYQSRKALVFYTQSAQDLFFVSRYGQFRVNSGDKTIYYRQYDNDSVVAAVMAAFRNPQMLGMLDSLFLSGATVALHRQDKDLMSYVLQYPSLSSIREMKLVYDTRIALFKSISYLFERPAPDRQSKIQQQVLMDHYSRTMPAEVQQLEEKSRDLKAYLSSRYKGYTLKTI